ncbi:MAG: MMPL family transporter [Bacteroidetes bacterium]|nr:MMPL family transporter [Bacteroidota bacterium]
MSNLFIYIYILFSTRRWLFWLFLGAVFLFVILGVSRIRFVEDISGSSSKVEMLNRFDFVVSHFQFAEKLVINLSFADTTMASREEYLCMAADTLATAINFGCKEYIRKMFYKPDDSLLPELIVCTRDYLPLFLEDGDYLRIDTMTSTGNIEKAVKKAYRQLLSPASIVIRDQILNDPLGIQGLALRKLQALQGSDQYESYNGYILSKDHHHLLIFITPSNPPGETGKNGKFLKKLDQIIDLKINSGQSFRAEYFGAAAVAAGNAERIKKDIILTLLIAFLAIFLLLGFYFRSVLVPLLGLLPAVFGGGLAIAVLAFVKGSVSAIALGIGSVILGLIIDYSLYLINQYRRCGDVRQTLREMSQSIVVCALTSAGAFLCLVFLKSSVLHDLGWFASVSVTGAALFALVFLPQMFSERFREKRPSAFSTFIDRIGSLQFERNYILIVILGLLCFASLFFFRKAGFETDMNTLNYMESGLRKAGDELDSLSNGKFKNIYIVATGACREEALRLNERIQLRLDAMIQNRTVAGVSGIRSLLLSDSLSGLRINKWEAAFPAEKSRNMIVKIDRAASQTGFTPGAFNGFDKMVGKSYELLDPKLKSRFENALFSEWINFNQGMSMITSIAKVKPANVVKIYEEFGSMTGVVVFDRQKLTDRFVEGVRKDFDRLVLLSMLFVSLLLWFSFGRIELALFTAIPMYLSWIITLGFMGVTGIRFNIFNIIISSFIFGLGVDYSILMMRGLMQDYKYRSQNISSYRISIMLSSSTTLFGVAALFTARHPALHSIALISVFGILVLVLITFSIQPLVVGWFMTERLRRNKFPVTARIFVKTIITWGNIVLIAIILTVTGWLMYFLLPLKRSWKENIFHNLFCSLSRLYIFLAFPNRRLYNPIGEDFKKPALIISNHQSLVETPAMLRLYPKMIILTNTWVYNSPVFGPIARLANFYNVDKGLDYIMEKLKKKVSEGYSLLIFPEAHRSTDHKIQRFHRGAFYIAEKLQLDILPVMMFGTGEFLAHGAFWGRPNMFRQRIYPRIKPDDSSFGTSYQERTRLTRRWYIKEYDRFRAEEGNASFYRRKLVLNYIYKGPVLEWYLKIKLMLEKNYSLLNEYVPRQGEILDMGCGYGFISYMLALTSAERMITGIDYDDDKIRVAEGGFIKSLQVTFKATDIRLYEFSPKDCIILSDVLHYILPADQERLLMKCMTNLKQDGIVIIRDADANREEGHSRSRLTELFSTGMKFNKTYGETSRLHFISTDRIRQIASQTGFSLEIIGSKTYSSNTYYLLKRNLKTIQHT